MRIERAFWIWLNHTSTHVLQGLPGGGGQPGVFFGQSGRELEEFFKDANAIKIGRSWTFSVQAHAGLPKWHLRIVQRGPSGARARECYLTSSQASSKNAYPLWQQAVTPIPSGEKPRQAIVFLVDRSGNLHARVWGRGEIRSLPSHLRSEVETIRLVPQKRHFVPHAFSLQKHAWEEGGLSTPNPEDWKWLAKLSLRIEGKRPAAKKVSYTRFLRNRSMRNLFIKCFGYECQVRECVFTRRVSSRLQQIVAEVHHIREWSQSLDDSPLNLSVVCANHHRIFTHFAVDHGLALDVRQKNIVVKTPEGDFVIGRQLRKFENALKKERTR